MAVVYDTPLLTMGQVQKWEARKAELEQVIQEAKNELEVIEENLEFATHFVRMQSGQKPETPKAETPVSPPEERRAENVGDAIVRVVRRYPNGALPSEIKRALDASDFDMARFSANPGYFYTVLGRLVHRGRLERRRNGLYRVPAPQASPEGETGAVAAPASVVTH